MKLIVIENRKIAKPGAIIGKTGVIRFNKNLSAEIGLVKDSYWSVALDEEEKIIKSIYILKAKNKLNAAKILFANNRTSIDIKDILENFKIKYPNICKVEDFDSRFGKGIVLKLEKF